MKPRLGASLSLRLSRPYHFQDGDSRHRQSSARPSPAARGASWLTSPMPWATNFDTNAGSMAWMSWSAAMKISVPGAPCLMALLAVLLNSFDFTQKVFELTIWIAENAPAG
jgi:hypothetical protein